MSKPVSNRIATDIPTIGEVWTSETLKHRRRSIIREFALNTSTHGLPGIARSESKHNRVFWTISFLIFTGIMIFLLLNRLKNILNIQHKQLYQLLWNNHKHFLQLQFVI